MLRLRALFFTFACCLTVVVSAHASASLELREPQCKALQEMLVKKTDNQPQSGESEMALGLCMDFSAIQTPGNDGLSLAPSHLFQPAILAELAIAKRPASIERPPRT